MHYAPAPPNYRSELAAITYAAEVLCKRMLKHHNNGSSGVNTDEFLQLMNRIEASHEAQRLEATRD